MRGLEDPAAAQRDRFPDAGNRELLAAGLLLIMDQRNPSGAVLPGGASIEMPTSMAALLDAAPYAIICVDPSRRVMAWNLAAERIFGYTAAEVVGGRYPLVPPGLETEFETLFDRVLAGQILRDVRVRRRRKDDKIVDVQFSGNRFLDADGQVRGIMYVLEDVTEKIATERQLQHAQKMESIGNLTGGIAHDFNNLLLVITGNLELLKDMVTEPLARELVDAAVKASEHGAELTRQLTAFARRQTLMPVRVEINELIAGFVKLLRRTLGDNIEISVVPGAKLWPVTVDPAQLESALLNLAVNARDAMPAGGRLTLSTSNRRIDREVAGTYPEFEPGDYVLVEVSDTGTGMPPDVLNRIFEPFFTTKDTGKGTGLGLSMVYGFVKQSGGHVSAYSEEGFGTTIRIFLPRLVQEAGETPATDAAKHATPRGSETLLVVDDNEDVRRLVTRQLSGLGYAVKSAESAVEALSLIERDPEIDAVLSDIAMPGGMNGVELAKRLAAERPLLPVVLTSGFAAAAMRGSGSIPDDTVILSKPYNRSELAQVIRRALDARAGSKEPTR